MAGPRSCVIPLVTLLATGCTTHNPAYKARRDGSAKGDGAITVVSPDSAIAKDSSNDSAPAGRGPVAYWKLDEGTGTLCADSSGNGLAGTLKGGVAWLGSGFLGARFTNPAALDFNGQDGVVDVGAPAALANLRTLTAAAWIKARSGGVSGVARIIDKRQFIAGWHITMCSPPDPGCPDGLPLTFRRTFAGGEVTWSAPAGIIAKDTWQHVAVVHDGSSITSDAILYINGMIVAAMRGGTPSGDLVDDGANALTIGGNTAQNRPFDGAIDDVRIYDRLLSAAEVASLAAGNP